MSATFNRSVCSTVTFNNLNNINIIAFMWHDSNILSNSCVITSRFQFWLMLRSHSHSQRRICQQDAQRGPPCNECGWDSCALLWNETEKSPLERTKYCWMQPSDPGPYSYFTWAPIIFTEFKSLPIREIIEWERERDRERKTERGTETKKHSRK